MVCSFKIWNTNAQIATLNNTNFNTKELRFCHNYIPNRLLNQFQTRHHAILEWAWWDIPSDRIDLFVPFKNVVMILNCHDWTLMEHSTSCVSCPHLECTDFSNTLMMHINIYANNAVISRVKVSGDAHAMTRPSLSEKWCKTLSMWYCKNRPGPFELRNHNKYSE